MLYYPPCGPSAAELALTWRLDEMYTAYPFYGDAVLTTSPFSVLFGAQRPAVGVN